MNAPIALSYQQAVANVDPGAVAAAESVKARIQSAYVMAMQRPRNEMQSRSRILEACKRPEFAGRVEYAKPVGGKKMVGPSIRFAELAVREWGNVITETQLVYEDERVRRIKVTVIDLETNATFGKEVQINKTIERKEGKGREIVGERTNTYGDKVFIVLATEDEMHSKEAALISKVIRNEGLRLIPSDIVDEAIEVARSTIHNRDAKDPKAATKKLVDAFGNIGIAPKHLEKYLSHSLDIVSPSELQDLRGIYQAISSGESSWADYVVKPESKPANDVNEMLRTQSPPAAQAPAQAPEPQPEPQLEPILPERLSEPATEPAQEPDPQPEQPTRKRHTFEELDGMRADAVAEIAANGFDLAEIEAKVGEYSNKWNAAQMERIRNRIIPNMRAIAAGA